MTTTLMVPRTRGGAGAMDHFRHEMADLFDRFFDHSLAAAPAAFGGGSGWLPPVDVAQTEAALVVTADLPGVAAADVAVTVRDGMLVIEGERAGGREEKGKEFLRVERHAGRFARTVLLPPVADPEGIRAEFAGGVLTVTIPKKPGAVPRKVPVAAIG